LGLGLSPGAGILLGAILAPTDPVLASDVQVVEVNDRDRLRFCLTGEGGLNDGAAFPFVMLGLGLLGLHDLGAGQWRWFIFDVLWPISGGLLIGGALGSLIGKLVVTLRSRHKVSVGLDEFLALGLIALTYGTSVLCQTYGFLAVFAAGLALQRVQERSVAPDTSSTVYVATPQECTIPETTATHPKYASAFMHQAVQGFNEQLERIAEVVVVLVVGAMLAYAPMPDGILWFSLLLFLVVRPVSVWLGLIGAPVSDDQRILISWFGIRGIGSVYYLMFAINHGLPHAMANVIASLTLSMVTLSIVIHGISVTPLMRIYFRRKARRQAR